MARPRSDLTGRAFGHWTVLRPVNAQRSTWLCQCICGQSRHVLQVNLVSGRSRSCGCGGDGFTKVWIDECDSAIAPRSPFAIALNQLKKLKK